VLERFFPLIGNARSLASEAALPLAEIGARLYALAREEQELPLPSRRADGEKSDPGLPAEGPDLSRCRLAVYAWVDEILLASERPDASLWVAHSLQHTFFQTSAAGMLFFQALDELLDTLLPLTGQAESEAEAETALPARLETAARLSREENFARRELDVFALCLLLGFCGRYFEMPQQREKLREAARLILRGSEGAKPPALSKRGWREQEFPRALEWIFYALLPLAGTLAFGLYCANLLLGAPRIGF
jgi:type VI protein secretion system component VasF